MIFIRLVSVEKKSCYHNYNENLIKKYGLKGCNLMKFKCIVIFTVKDYNKNKEKDGYLPQNGTVINAFVGSNGMNCLAVGYVK